MNSVTIEVDRDLGSSIIKNMVNFGRQYKYSSGQLVTAHMFDDINLQMVSAKETSKSIFWPMIAPQQAMALGDVFWPRKR